MNEYELTLKFSLPESNDDHEAFIARLAEAGCQHAPIGIGRNGRITLDFSRSAESAIEAIANALRDVWQSILAARLVEALPDLWG